MAEPVAPPLPTLPVSETGRTSVPAQSNGSSAGSSNTSFELPPETTSIRVTEGAVEYVTADGKKRMRRASEGSPVELTVGIPDGDVGRKALAKDLIRAQRDIVHNISTALQNSMDRIGTAFMLYLVMNLTLFGIGIVSFILAVVKSLGDPSRSDLITSAAYGGLTTVAFLTFFVTKPLKAIDASGAKMAWLLATVNSYWTKLVYMNENETVLEDLQQAQEQFEASMATYLAAAKDADDAKADDDKGADSDGESTESDSAVDQP